MTNPYMNSQDVWQSTYTQPQQNPVTVDMARMQELLNKSLEIQKRDQRMLSFIDRFSRGEAEGERLPDGCEFVTSIKSYSRMGEEVCFVDRVTMKTYTAFRPDRQHYKVGKNAFAQMKYSVGIDMGQIQKDEWKVKYMGDWIGDMISNIKEPAPSPLCKSCKTHHKVEELDLIGRCSVKLKSHHEKLRKIKNAHNHKKHDISNR